MIQRLDPHTPRTGTPSLLNLPITIEKRLGLGLGLDLVEVIRPEMEGG